MKNDVEEELMVSISLFKCKRARRLIVKGMEGSYVDEFNHLESYCNELKRSNPGSDVSLELSKEALENGNRVFSRLYMCFNAAKMGWKAGCRPIIGVNGTFLKGNARGIMLTATGLDANDSIYPIAIGITQKENTVNWKWFCQWLKRSLKIEEGDNITIMSDM
ncbi:hypothetical protein QN277_021962 [Acacia crassicarpa]|uniref:MULE transposase domain-containing protein n=1 Tax=Acacia crassicarpa TaxID=499986 RepID=A0AAE1KFB4_9FABA|nr:hypothetical protein QN277_021962 [Acacia crassicarpa]